MSSTATALWLVNDTVVAAMQANDWDATESMRARVGKSAVDGAGLRDPSVPLDRLLP